MEKPLELNLKDSRISLFRHSWKLTRIQHPLGVVWQYIILGPVSDLLGLTLVYQNSHRIHEHIKILGSPSSEHLFPEGVNVGITFGTMKQHRAVVPAPRGPVHEVQTHWCDGIPLWLAEGIFEKVEATVDFTHVGQPALFSEVLFHFYRVHGGPQAQILAWLDVCRQSRYLNFRFFLFQFPWKQMGEGVETGCGAIFTPFFGDGRSVSMGTRKEKGWLLSN